MNCVGFVGSGHYAGALAQGMFGAVYDVNSSLPDILVVIHDVDGKHSKDLVSKLRLPCKFAASAHEVFDAADVVFLGVPQDQVNAVLSDFRAAAVRRNPAAGVILMDGIESGDIRSCYPDIHFGIMMYNYPVAYRCGISAFWPGTLSSKAVTLTKECLKLVGATWTVDDPGFLHVVRATAGCGFGILAMLADDMERAMVSAGLSAAMSQQALGSIVKGLAAHMETGGTALEAARLAGSPSSPVMARILTDPQRSVVERMLQSVFAESITHYRNRS